jgi:predicted nucleotide-binding protein
MEKLAPAFAKLAGVRNYLAENKYVNFDPAEVKPHFERYQRAAQVLKEELPHLYDDLVILEIPEPKPDTIFEGRGYIERHRLEALAKEIDYIFEVRANSNPGGSLSRDMPPAVFITHGRNQVWREVQAFIEKDVGLDTVELEQQPNRGRTIIQKLNDEAEQCGFGVIIMTAEDEAAFGPPRARENVIHEIGFLQGRLGLDRICILHEEGTNVPSNISGIVYIPFPKDTIRAGFGALQRELKAAFGH